mmetsp:Transcript_28454/g.50093  ORF Transcript_28454/g.50093 Transcript_28454/m.50093 type:complete len:221 (-) Transcript_28454:1034-1696(-)
MVSPRICLKLSLFGFFSTLSWVRSSRFSRSSPHKLIFMSDFFSSTSPGTSVSSMTLERMSFPWSPATSVSGGMSASTWSSNILDKSALVVGVRPFKTLLSLCPAWPWLLNTELTLNAPSPLLFGISTVGREKACFACCCCCFGCEPLRRLLRTGGVFTADLLDLFSLPSLLGGLGPLLLLILRFPIICAALPGFGAVYVYESRRGATGAGVTYGEADGTY